MSSTFHFGLFVFFLFQIFVMFSSSFYPGGLRPTDVLSLRRFEFLHLRELLKELWLVSSKCQFFSQFFELICHQFFPLAQNVYCQLGLFFEIQNKNIHLSQVFWSMNLVTGRFAQAQFFDNERKFLGLLHTRRVMLRAASAERRNA